MKDTDRRFHIRVAEVLIEGRQVARHHQPFISQGFIRQATDIKLAVVCKVDLSQTATDKQGDTELTVILVPRQDENLLDTGQAVFGHGPEAGAVGGHFAPTRYIETLLGQTGFESLPRCGSFRFIGAQKDHTNGVHVAQLHAQAGLGSLSQERVGLLQQQTAAVAGFAVGGDPAAVGHAGQRLDCRLQECMTGFAFHMGDEAESAVVLELTRLIETCLHKPSHIIVL